MEALNDWIPAQQAADELGLSRPRVHQLVRDGAVEGMRIAGRLLVSRSSLAELRRRRTNARPTVTMAWLRQRRTRILKVAARHGARNVRVFGSVARGDARAGSDVDLLVTMEPERSVLDLAELMVELETVIGRPVDVVESGRSAAARRLAAHAVPL